MQPNKTDPISFVSHNDTEKTTKDLINYNSVNIYFKKKKVSEKIDVKRCLFYIL